MMKHCLAIWGFAFCLFFLSPAPFAQENEGDAVLGRWIVENKKSVIEIYKQADRYCGRIVWLAKPKNPDGTYKRDLNNPDPEKRNRPRLGMDVVWGFTYAGNRKWKGGKVYDPKTGKTYESQATLEENKLKVRGYVGTPLFGRTIVCTRTQRLSANHRADPGAELTN